MAWWTRLEGMGRSDALTPGLEARVADPLWMLARQWQIGELRGDDAARPVGMTVSTRSASISEVSGPAGSLAADAAVPMEYVVERRPRPSSGHAATHDAVRLGHRLVRNASIYHLEPESQVWTVVGQGPGCLRGIQVDTMGRAFIAHNGFPGGLVVVDTATKTIINGNVPLPGSQTPVGVSIDVEGFVWVVDQGGWAYKVDPETYQVVLQVTGLNQPYTYSDMTGAGLNLVVNPLG